MFTYAELFYIGTAFWVHIAQDHALISRMHMQCVPGSLVVNVAWLWDSCFLLLLLFVTLLCNLRAVTELFCVSSRTPMEPQRLTHLLGHKFFVDCSSLSEPWCERISLFLLRLSKTATSVYSFLCDWYKNILKYVEDVQFFVQMLIALKLGSNNGTCFSEANAKPVCDKVFWGFILV